MDQHVFLRLENGEIVSFEDASMSGTSYVVQDGVDTSTSYVVESDGIPNASYIVPDSSVPGTSYVLDNGAISKASYPGNNGNTSTQGYGEAAVGDDVAVENDGAENIVYIVQQEGVNTENMQYAVVGEAGSISSTFAIQGVDSGNEKQRKENREFTHVQDMSGIETLSRVATQEFASSIIHKSVEKVGTEVGKGTSLHKQNVQNETDGKCDDNVKVCFSCQHCGEEFADLANFRHHIKNEHESGEFDEESDGKNDLTLYLCQVCSQTFIDVKELEAHKKVHFGDLEDLQGITFEKIEQGMAANIKMEGNSFKCKGCASKFVDRSTLIKHIRTEHSKGEAEEKSSSSFTKCPYCHKMYVQRGNNRSMIKHIYSAHPGKSVEEMFSPADKAYQLEEKVNCIACGLGFYWQKSLIRHMKDRHPKLLEEKGDQIFAELGIQDLQMPNVKHRRSVKDGSYHSDLLNCPNCPKKFLWEKSLRRHMACYHDHGERTGKRMKKMPVVYCCPHCSLVSKYACAVRKHMERKHPQLIKDVDVTTVPLPTMESEAAMDIEFKTIDKRPAEVRLNFCPVIYRCPFCLYASKQGSNLIRHLTSVKHGNIFTQDELKEIGITSFKVKQDLMKEDDMEKLDGTSSKKLPKLKLRGTLLDIVMKKYEFLKHRKLENKENGIMAVENEDDYSDMDIDNIIDFAEDESEESFNEEEEDNIYDKSCDNKETESREGLREKRGSEIASENVKTRCRKDKIGNSGRKVQGSTVSDYTGEISEASKEQVFDEKMESNNNEGLEGKSLKKTINKSSSDIEMGEVLSDENIVLHSDFEVTVDLETDNDRYEVSGEKSELLNVTQDNTKKSIAYDSKEATPTRKIMKNILPTKPDGTEQKIIKDAVVKRTSLTQKVMSVDRSRISLRNRGKSAHTDVHESRKLDSVKSGCHVCKVCKKEFNNFTSFKQHLSAHVNVKVFFRCVDCGCEVAFLKDLKIHLLKEHNLTYSESNLTCLHTDFVNMDSKPVTTYDCPYCEMLFSQSSTLQQHIIMDHSDNVQSARIKQENTSTKKCNITETVVTAFNCRYCECFYHNLKDMVKHMYMLHRDVDRSETTGQDLSVRKSVRKRRLPKWLEEANDDINKMKRPKLVKNTETEKIVNTSFSRQRERTKSGALESGGASLRDKEKEKVMTDTEKAKNIRSSEKNKIDVKTKENFKQVRKDACLNLTGSQKASKSPNAESRTSKGDPKIVKRLDYVKTQIDSLDTLDKTETQNKCPHCDFIAKRSTALAFHINFKHANVKDKDSLDIEKQESGKQSAVVSPEKIKTKDPTEMSTNYIRKKEKSSKLEDPKVTSKGVETKSTEVEVVESEVPDRKGKETSTSKAIMKKKSIISKRNTFVRDIEETEDEMETENEFGDYDIEYGDSDDDYRPEKDDYEDCSSNSEESDNEDDTGKGNISIKFKCPYCQIGTFTRFSLLESHVKVKHPKQANSFSIADVKTEVELDKTVRVSDLVHSCKYCDKRFLSKLHVRAHIKSRHRKKFAAESKKKKEGLKKSNMELYKCKLCNMVADSKEGVLSHMSKQHPLEKDINMDDIQKYTPEDKDDFQDLFKCPHCEKKSKWKQVILRHIDNFHSDVAKTQRGEITCQREIVSSQHQNKYQCVYCNWQYDRKTDVLTHMMEAHPDQPSVSEADIFEVDISDKAEDHFQCPYCSLQSKYKRCIIRHVGRAHKHMKGFTKSDVICLSTKKSRNSVSEGLVFMCPFCDFDSRWKQCITRHVDHYHPDVVDFDPEIIPSEYRKRSILNLDDIYPVDYKESDLEYFKCSFCDAVSETKEGVAAHTFNNHPKKSDFKLNDVEKAVWNEVVTSDEDIVYKCPVCDSGSKWKKRVVLHVRADHPEVKKFHVELCKVDLKRREDHIGSVFMCKLCNELFTSTRGVAAHALQVHGKEEQIVVETVPANQKLTNVFRCIYCDHRSTWRNAIVRHVDIHHPVMENFQAKDVICEIVQEGELGGTGGFQCPYCDTVNHWKKSIVRHMKTVHPNKRHDIEIHFNPTVSVRPGGRSSRKSSKQINCLRCGTSCRSMEKMRKHFLTQHPKLAKNFLNKENTEFSYESFDGRPLDYVCVLCNAKYMWKKSLLVHVKNRHRETFQVYQALDHMVDIVACAAGPGNTANQQPVVTNPSIVKDTAIAEPGRCEKCRLVFKTQWAAHVHQRLKHRKHSKRRFQCGKCSLSFPTRSLHLRHRLRYHGHQRPSTTLYCNVSDCDFRCKFSRMLQNHYKNKHGISIPVPGSSTFTTYNSKTVSSGRCEICLRNFSSAYQLKQHVALHKKQRRVRFQCGTCGEQFLTRTLRDSHIETFHLDKAEMCDICGALFARSNLKKHMRTHDEERAEEKECPYCQKVVTAKMLNKHVLHEHQEILNCQCGICRSEEESSNQPRYRCVLCKQSFCQKPMLYLHSKLHHLDGQKLKLFHCEACPDLCFVSKRMKDAHCHDHHKQRTTAISKSSTVTRSTSTSNNNDPMTHVIHVGQDEGRQYLPKLSESSMNAVIKELLVVEKQAENPYKCLLCGRSFTKSKYIKLHIRRAHVRDEDQPYRCKVCGSGFVRLTEFRKHSRSHSDFRPYKCRYCDKAFKQQANLRDHYRVHTNTKEYECYICKTEFRQRGGLTSHVVFHDTLKPFKCMYCQKGFTTRGELSRHMQKYNKDVSETAEKNYPCHICEESFPHYPMLLKHIDTHNPEKPFQCLACQEKFSNYVAMYFHKVKEEHFLLEEIQEGMKDLQKRGRKFRAKKNNSKLPGPEIVYARNQPVTETIYISQPDAYSENERSVKPVEVIIEEFGQEQVVHVQENEPEHEELLSIAKQLTELSAFHGSKYYTKKKNVNQEEDEIIKNMLDADEDVLATLTKQGASYKTYEDERGNISDSERQEQSDVKRDVVEENYEYMAEIVNDVRAVEESAACDEGYSYDVETGGQVKISAASIPTNMEELVSLVSQNPSASNSDQVMAYQSEDGSVIYVCLPEDQNIKTEEVVAVETLEESDMVADTEAVVEEADKADFNMECNEAVEELYEESGETVTSENKVPETTGTTSEEQAMETDSVNIIHIPVAQQAEPGSEIQQSETTDVEAQQNDYPNKKASDEGEHHVTQTADIQPFETSEIQMTQYITTEQDIPVTNEQQILTANQSEISSVEEIQDQDYTIVEPKFENSVITIQPQDRVTDVIPESQEDLIRRSQLARHLTGNVQPTEETSRIQTHLIVTEQGLQSISSFEPLVSEDVTQGESISQSLITISATVSDQENVVVQDPVNSSSSFEQVAVTRQGESFVEGEETLVEYQIDESRFIKEELLDTEYSAMSEKEREVMFFSDNIYTYSQLEKKFICLHCGAKIGTFKNLKNHIRRHAPMSARTHVCTYCSKRFVTKNELKRHLYTHTGERNYECKDCGKKFIQPGHLQEHQRLHTGHKPFQCSECKAAFITKSQLVLHFSRLHSNNEIPCSKCDKVFKNDIDLRRHKGLEHSGTIVQTPVVKEEGGDYVCDICGQSFSKRPNLKRHLEKHNLDNIDESEKVQELFACEECGLSFRSKYYVKEHFKIAHSNEKNEICELCGMGFKSKGMLRRHKLCKHFDEEGNRKWHCDICNKSLGSKYAYGYHMGSKHSTVSSDD